MNIHLVCDTSGSMGYAGKAFTMRTVTQTIAQWIYLGNIEADLKIYSWGVDTLYYERWNVIDEFPEEMLSCKGSSVGQSLIEILGVSPLGKVLILTDGFWGSDTERQLKRWRNALAPDAVHFIKIGADSNPQLKGHNVFATEDWLAALEPWSGGAIS